ncbi:MAG: hypothetical protein METHP_01187 [Methanoregula sp. SKADARSKE-2]|nr:MAG: hypothetical protein METHP_01187 [Methanoregula sp. SKADARSKE-2]
MARELLDDWDVKYVIGPETSDEVYAIAPEYVHRKKALITPFGNGRRHHPRFSGEPVHLENEWERY